jgi:IclR family transcriptional regulator, KDG regulon repressor
MNEIQSLARGLTVLQLMAEAEQGVSVTALAAQLGVNKATVSRMLHTLMNHGFVEKAPDGRQFQLGPTLVRLSRAVIDRLKLREVAKPYLKQLVEFTGECAHLAIYAQGQALYIDQVESDASLRVNADVGHMAPLHCTALGKVLLAFGGYPFPEELEKRTAFTCDSAGQLQKELSNIRQQGFAVDNEEYDSGVRCIAVPIFDYKGEAAGAIGISGPAARLKPEKVPEVARQVCRIGKALTDHLKFNK